MLFNKPILLNLSEDVIIVSVKDMEKVYKVDIGGTWLYEPNILDDVGPTIRLFFRVRYNGTVKEPYKELVTKFDVFTIDEEYKVKFNLTKALEYLDFVHIYTKPESDSYTKEYFVRFIAYSEEYGTCEIYMAFPICSADSMVSGTLKKIEKKLKKYIK
jgi:hypothetical protein